MKRNLALILVLLQLLLCMFQININASEADAATEEYKFLEYLNILQNDKNPNDNVSRADFSVYVARMLGIGETGTETKTYFYDVDESSWCAYAIGKLAEQGLISVGEDKTFRPNDDITYAEACKIVVCALGYGKWAEYNGGFPRGYFNAARRIDIIGGNINESALKYSDMVELLYNSLFANTYEVSSIGKETAEFNADGKSLLELYYNLNFTEGIVESANGFSAYADAEPTEDKIVVINGVKYNTELYLPSYLGKNLRFIYTEGRNGALNSVVYVIEEADVNNVVEINYADYIDYSPVDNKISYYSDNERRIDAGIKTNANFVYNGSALSKNVENVLDGIENGTIRLIDNDADRVYDVVIAESYRNIIVNYIDDSAMKIYDKYDNKTPLDYNPQNRVFRVFTNISEQSASDIKIGDVLTVYESDYAVTAYITNTKLTGEITKINKRNDVTYVIINDNEYRIDNSFSAVSGKTVSVGLSAEFKLNRVGDIVDITTSLSEDGYTCAYVIDYKLNKNVFKTELKIKVYIPYKGIETIVSDEKLVIDGNKTSDGDEIRTALEKCGEMKGQIIRIKTNEDKLLGIDTTAVDENGGGIKIGQPKSPVRYRRNKFGAKVLINASTIVLTVPTDENAEDYRYGILDVAGLDLDSDYNVTTYKMDLNSGFEDIVVVENGGTNEPTYALALVKDVSDALYDDEIVDSIECIHGGSDNIYYASEAGLIKSKNYKQGDVIRLGFDERGRVCSTALVYSYNSGLKISEVAENYSDASQFAYKSRITAGYAMSVNDGVLRTYKTNPNELYEVFDIKNAKLTIYDSSQRDGKKVYIGNYNDLKTFKNSASPAMVIARADQATLMEVIVFQ